MEKQQENKPIHICFASDNNYAPYMGMAIFSILKNSQTGDNFLFYILEDGISESRKNEIQGLVPLSEKLCGHAINARFAWLPISTDMFSHIRMREKRLSATTFARFFVPKLIPDDKVLYLDCDTMARDSLKQLWDTDISDSYLAGVPDLHVIKNGKIKQRLGEKMPAENYVNAGVLLINNKLWKQDGISEKLISYTAENHQKLIFNDQDAINFVCRDRIRQLPFCWNVMGCMYKTDLFAERSDLNEIICQRDNAKIRHFHPWKKNWFMPHREEYIELMAKSPWEHLIPQDDRKDKALLKCVLRYFKRHPFAIFKPSFYKKWKMRGTECMFFDW